MNTNKYIKALVVYLTWLFIGGIFSSWGIDQFIMASMGGVFTPPTLWLFCRDLGFIIFPLLAILGGIPTVLQILRRRPWRLVAVVSILIYILIWLIFMTIVVWGPPAFGWSW